MISWLSSQRARVYCWLASAAGCGILAIVSLWLGRHDDAVERTAALLEDSVDGFGLYVNERLCSECHPSQSASHANTGHANLLRRTALSETASALDGKTFKDPERECEYHYQFDSQGGLSVTIAGQFDDASFPLAYAIGSGKRATTFLALIPNRLGETTGVEHRVSVYSSEGGPRLDLTEGQPKQTPEQDVEHFGRVIRGDTLARCVECHTTGGEIVGQEIRGFMPNISCQNCHGPRREHVIAMKKAEDRGTSTSPRGSSRLTAVEEIRMCSRCHPRPGMEEEQDVAPNHIRSVRLQSTEFLQSKCYEKSNDRLSCSTCHDPHEPISRDRSHYVKRCLDCHAAPDSVHCPVSPQTKCVQCHMPLVQADDGTQFHDHRIRVGAQTE